MIGWKRNVPVRDRGDGVTDIRVIPTREAFSEWRQTRRGQEMRDWIAECGYTALMMTEYADRTDFLWICPGCGYGTVGTFGDAPVSGWDDPRWTREGDDEHLTLTPSLGCPRWRDGECTGHYWLRDGKLVQA